MDKMSIEKHKKVYVAPTGHIGKGLFAKIDIKEGEIVFVAKGTLVEDDYNDDYLTGPYWLWIREGLWLSPFDVNPWRYINHSCDPNVGIQGKVTVVAMKDIRGGEEVTIDYSITEDDPYWEMECRCGKRGCRKIIRSIRFLPEEMYKKYEPYVPRALRKSYEKYR